MHTSSHPNLPNKPPPHQRNHEEPTAKYGLSSDDEEESEWDYNTQTDKDEFGRREEGGQRGKSVSRIACNVRSKGDDDNNNNNNNETSASGRQREDRRVEADIEIMQRESDEMSTPNPIKRGQFKSVDETQPAGPISKNTPSRPPTPITITPTGYCRPQCAQRRSPSSSPPKSPQCMKTSPPRSPKNHTVNKVVQNSCKYSSTTRANTNMNIFARRRDIEKRIANMKLITKITTSSLKDV